MRSGECKFGELVEVCSWVRAEKDSEEEWEEETDNEFSVVYKGDDSHEEESARILEDWKAGMVLNPKKL